jgi:hypothetical protein
MAEVTDPNLLSQLNATGDDFLKTLPSDRASMVKAMAEGRQGLPAGYSMRSPFAQQLLSDVAQYDPTFDAANLPARIATRKAFTSGKQGQNITSFNTALGHLGTLAQAAEDLKNTGSIPLLSTTVNGIKNAISAGSGNPQVTNFNVAKQAVVDELERAFKGTGGNVHEIEQWENTLNASRSPEQLRGAIKQAAELLNSRIGAMRDSYNAGMGTTDQPLPMLNPHASDALAQFESKDYLDKGYGIIAHGGGSGGTGGGSIAPGTPPTPPAGGQPGAPNTPLDPNGEGDIGFNQPGGGGAPHSPLNPAQQAAYDAFNKANPKATADQLRAFGQSIGVNFGNADDVVKARDAGAGVLPGADAIDAPRGPDDAAHTATNEFANTATFGVLPKVSALLAAGSDKINGNAGSFGDLYDRELAAKNGELTASETAHPYAALAGDTAGFLTGDGILSAAPGVAKLAGRIPGTLRPIVGDALYGAAYGAGSSDSLADVPGNVVKGALLSGGGGMVGRGVVKGVANVLSPVANAAVRRLTDAGVTLTPGQILGGGGLVGNIVKGIEDRAAGFPVVGDIISSARRGGVEDFNRAAINDALAPIGETASDVGHAGIADAQQKVSDAYDKALAGMSATPDAQFTDELTAVGAKAKTLSQDYRERLANVLDTDVQPYLNGKSQLDGSDLQAIKQGLDKRIAGLSGQGSSPQDRELADRLGEARDAVLDLAGRTDPASAADFQAANKAYSLLSRVQGAAAKSKDGVFSPNQFRQAVTKRGYGTTTAKVASGSAPMQQLATDASTILPSSVPDSGTSGRAALAVLGGKLAGGGTGALLGGAAGYKQEGVAGALAGAALGAGAFTRPGLRITQKILAGSRGRKLDTLGDLLRRNANLGGAVGSPLLLENMPK